MALWLEVGEVLETAVTRSLLPKGFPAGWDTCRKGLGPETGYEDEEGSA